LGSGVIPHTNQGRLVETAHEHARERELLKCFLLVQRLELLVGVGISNSLNSTHEEKAKAFLDVSPLWVERSEKTIHGLVSENTWPISWLPSMSSPVIVLTRLLTALNASKIAISICPLST
jgi:hypothetical protein